MITLCGSTISNYYNKVKLALLEKGIAFTEEKVNTGSNDDVVLSATPLGKIPFIRTPHGALCESQVILDYLETTHPQPALIPADPWQAAKVRELITFIDTYLEMTVRQLYPKAFFGGELSDANAARIRTQLEKQIVAFKRLAKFSPYVAGNSFTLADCAAWANLPLVSMATKAVYGEDLLVAGGIDVKGYTKLIDERPTAQKVKADRKADQAKA
ncbi:MAG: glutathione S-transferase family protein [Cytophagales bacterium]|nr:glutathione S-transferase family protein [Rhizobacter sp.]